MYKLYCRAYQTVLKLVSPLLPWRQPELIEGENSVLALPSFIQHSGIRHVFIVTDKGISSLGLMNPLLEQLRVEGITYTIFDNTVPNPTIHNIEEAVSLYKSNQCQGLVAFGGGSPIDCAKAVAARIAKPHKKVQQMKGILKVMTKLPPLYAIPTTAGTGSEVTVAAVVTDEATHEKYAMMDPALIPHAAVLDPLLTVNLPPHITSTTGIDALTHAVEAYIGRGNTRATKQYSRDAVTLIFENLVKAYRNGGNITARKNMQKAAYYAGAAFTRAYVGNVHAIAHQLGGLYGVPHGLANAVILPYVLEYYGAAVYKPLSELADLVGICKADDSLVVKAVAFIEEIKRLNEVMNIPNKIEGIQDEHIPLIAKNAVREANPLYPVPVIFSEREMTEIICRIKA